MHPRKKRKKNTVKAILSSMICGCGRALPPKPGKRTPDSLKTPFEEELGPPASPRLLRSPCTKIDESVAMVKESVKPFEDFRASMKQMIEERGIETEDDLKELLRCFLDINLPPHHNVIVRAFIDVCSDVKPPHDRRLRSLGRLLRLYVNPFVDESSHTTK